MMILVYGCKWYWNQPVLVFSEGHHSLTTIFCFGAIDLGIKERKLFARVEKMLHDLSCMRWCQIRLDECTLFSAAGCILVCIYVPMFFSCFPSWLKVESWEFTEVGWLSCMWQFGLPARLEKKDREWQNWHWYAVICMVTDTGTAIFSISTTLSSDMYYTTGTIHEKWHWKGCWWFHQLPCTQEEANHLRLRLRRTRRLSGTNYCRLRCRSVYSMTHFIELDDGKLYRKPLYLMVKTMVSCRFSLKPIHWPIPFKELGVSKDSWIFMADQSLWFLASTLHGKNHAKSFLGICHILAQLRFEGVPPEQWELERWHEWAELSTKSKPSLQRCGTAAMWRERVVCLWQHFGRSRHLFLSYWEVEYHHATSIPSWFDHYTIIIPSAYHHHTS